MQLARLCILCVAACTFIQLIIAEKLRHGEADTRGAVVSCVTSRNTEALLIATFSVPFHGTT